MSTTYNDIKIAIQSQHDLMKQIVSLPDHEFRHLIQNPEEYYKRKIEEYNKEKQDIKDKQQEKLNSLKEQKTQQIKKRTGIAKEIQEKVAKLRKDSETQIREIKAAEKKILEEYLSKKKTEYVAKQTQVKLEAEEEFKKLADNGPNLAKVKEELASFYKQKIEEEDLAHRKQLLEYSLELQASLTEQTEKRLSEFRLQHRLREHEAKKDFLLQKEKELRKIDAHTRYLSEKIKYDSIMNFFSGDEGKTRMFNIGGVVVTSFAAFFGFKAAYPVLQRGLHSYFFKPTLVSRQVRQNRWSKLFVRPFTSVAPVKVILVDPLQTRMDGIIEATRNISARGGLFNNILLYGQPGTGKTLFSAKLAEESGMDFAVMSGPSFDQFEPDEAITEIKNLFKWANRSPRGLLLFVDEADSFLEDRNTLHPSRISVLNEWLNQTGTESRKFMCVYETNRPEILDPAVQSRITQSIEFPIPTQKEIREMFLQYTELYLIHDWAGQQRQKLFGFLRRKLIGYEQIDANVLKGMLHKIPEVLAAEKFVGRDVTNFVIALAQAAYATPNLALTEEIVESVLQQQITKKRKEREYLESRKERIKDYQLRMQTR